ncbi:hypothetical protein QJS83_00205 [Bdellovibrio sp. 22V]|uniref:hypothetical protein n=1 Tax=Bdellovibrio TaxID=958 RepID=UPI002543ED3E|nr:hypothetical protein [Bdellovibrio sp. 22V]WII72288.1 hypothetical protein QJS83_00205 [Bdellovibrio sp. 22V]
MRKKQTRKASGKKKTVTKKRATSGKKGTALNKLTAKSRTASKKKVAAKGPAKPHRVQPQRKGAESISEAQQHGNSLTVQPKMKVTNRNSLRAAAPKIKPRTKVSSPQNPLNPQGRH